MKSVEIDKIKFNSSTEKKKAIALIPGLENRYKKYSYNQKRQHVLQALLSKGFDIEVAKDAVEHLSKVDEKDEIKKLQIDFKKSLEKYSKKYEGRELKERIMRNLISKGYKYNDINKLLGGVEDDF